MSKNSPNRKFSFLNTPSILKMLRSIIPGNKAIVTQGQVNCHYIILAEQGLKPMSNVILES